MVLSFLLKPEFQQSAGRPSGPAAFEFAIAFIAVAISSFVGSIPRVVWMLEKRFARVYFCLFLRTNSYVCMYAWSSLTIAEHGSTGQGCQSCSWSAGQEM